MIRSAEPQSWESEGKSEGKSSVARLLSTIMKTAGEVTDRGGSTGTARGKRRAMSLGTFAAVICLVACLHLAYWALRNPHAIAPSFDGRLPSVSYNRFPEPSPDGLRVPEAQIRADLTAIAKYANAVRTYASTQGLDAFRVRRRRTKPTTGPRIGRRGLCSSSGV
jgi:hypothetical protein